MESVPLPPAPPAPPRAGGPRFSLVVKLVVLFAATLLCLEIPVLLVLVPRTRRQFRERTGDLILLSEEGLRDISETLIHTNEEVVVDLASHISEAYRRELADLPLTLARGDESKIKSLILDEVHQLRSRTLQNVDALGEELRYRSEAEVEARMEALRRSQGETGARFAATLQRESAGLSVFLALAPLPILLLGIFRMIVRPVSRLAEATVRAGQGDLGVSVPVTSADEIGVLQASFNRSVRELDRARREIERWNLTLEDRVARRTKELRASLRKQRETNLRLEEALRELRDTQGLLIQAEKMASLGNLSRSVAHEFNNVLGGILGSAEAALEEGPGGTTAEALDVIRRAARRACVVTENLLRFGHSHEPVRRPVEVQAVLGECLALMEPELRSRAIRVERDLPPLAPIPADAAQLHQVFLNLLSNAARAAGQGGWIRVAGRLAQGGGRGGAVEFSVTDSGPGVPEALRHRIFEPFFTARRGSERGTGLGLAVSYGIVAAHGGSIEVHRDPQGQGARFVVTLPSQEAPK